MNNLTIKCINGYINLKIKVVGNPYYTELKYSKDDGLLLDYRFNKNIELLENQSVSFSGTNNAFSKDTENFYIFKFEGSGYVVILGNLNSLTNVDINNSEIETPNFNRLFEGCTNIIDASNLELPFINLSKGCYARLFCNCSNLLTAPQLPATNLAEKCYWSMFEGCEKLSVAPALPATKLDFCCYQEMFEDCHALTSSPVLPATKLVSGCYYQMFYDCTSLNHVEVNFNRWRNDLRATDIWLVNNAITGTFKKPDVLDERTGNNYIPVNWVLVDKESEVIPDDLDDEEETVPVSQITIYKAGEGLALLNDTFILTAHIPTGLADWDELNNVNYIKSVGFVQESALPTKLSDLLNDSNFLTRDTDLREYAKIIQLPTKLSQLTNDKHYVTKNCLCKNFKFILSSLLTCDQLFRTFVASTLMNTVIPVDPEPTPTPSGDPEPVDPEPIPSGDPTPIDPLPTPDPEPVDPEPIPLPVDLFIPLTFRSTGNTSIQMSSWGIYLDDISLQYKVNDGLWTNYTISTTINLNDGDTVSFSGVNNTFNIGLNIGNYSLQYYQFNTNGDGTLDVYGEVISLTNKEGLNYNNLFRNCTNIVNASELVLPNELTYNCFASMFQGCTSLISAPQLPATELADACYRNMFSDCTTLTSIPLLPATKLPQLCYANMFEGCTSLTSVTLPSVNTTKYNCYNKIFNGCSNLTSITVSFTEWKETENWVANVSPTGTFIKLAVLLERYGNNYIPNGWNVIIH